MKKLLVANRSEIACRIFQACRELGLKSVALSAPGDECARHLTYADEVIEVDSYLNGDEIVAKALAAGVDLIHPGYGFLSERSSFAAAVEKSGILFIGPSGETMDRMGSKIESKELADQIGVPTVPWAKLSTDGGNGPALVTAAKKIGFPLLLKASAGGGGKGMRLVHDESELELAAQSASDEARAAFGEGTIFLEKFIQKPRHLEVQVFGDGKGDGVHFFERECSLQRRHQKVVEEAPAERLKSETRQSLLDSALKLVRSTQYRSAGTVEFIVDEDESIFFLEMNTRLQVEHPVTEWVNGVDLVHAQIQLALEGVVPKQPESPVGHSMEVRIYAEDPSRGYLPTPGRVETLRWPTGPGIRVDSGIEEGQEIGTLFDPMLAKLIVWAPTRPLAIQRLKYALEETVLLGVGNNLHFLKTIILDEKFGESKVDTGYLERAYADYGAVADPETLEVLVGAKAEGFFRRATTSAQGDVRADFPSPWFQGNGRKG